ncbi:Gfo/Idh/MocA family protein [Ktedonospora formicarum]|uniref:Oxidoreductase n=1 Tax=Ktedonospora formicarum TaxID=2778364 RepID=A0A8J3I3J4_9CHLR|nr:Gfo/Idh/MocA family oxidoreductase [Ktedonospora formicarum]GHO46215.1 oxidoreductase [Ktedonospora formicarum]
MEQTRLRHAIIGVGAGILNGHRPALKLPEVDLVAVSDVNVEVGQQRAQELGSAFYEDYRQMLAKERPDIVVILTPPFLHASMAIDSLSAGSHVLIEKPMAVQVEEADAMLEAARQNERQLGVVLQHRFRPEVNAARQVLQQGVLGEIQRVELVAMWPRPASYFSMAAWRATWRGEGGGILTNQAAHNLDVLCYLLGQPRRVVAWTRQLLHDIETEDTAHAMLEWSNGALGMLHISTAEADVAERLKIVGTRGSLEMGHGKLSVQTLDVDMREYRVSCLNPYGSPNVLPYDVSLEEGKGDHVAVYRDFHNAILNGTLPRAEGAQGLLGLELANAINYSSHKEREVVLPLDRHAYADLLADLREGKK